MEIEEKCKNCDGYNECFDGEDYSTDCDGGFRPRKDLVELQKVIGEYEGKLRKALDAIAKHKEATKFEPEAMYDYELYKTLEELR